MIKFIKNNHLSMFRKKYFYLEVMFSLRKFSICFLLFFSLLFSVDTDAVEKKEDKKKIWENFSWLYASYGLSMEYWIDNGGEFVAIDSLENYPNDEERPRQFNELKLGGLYKIPQLKNFGIYFEIPIVYNEVLPYQDAFVEDGKQFTDRETVFAIGDSTLGLTWRFLPVLTWIPYLKLPSMPLSQTREESRYPGGAWSGFGLFSIGNALQLSFRQHYAYSSIEIVAVDPFSDEEQAWALPGDFRLYLQYVYTFKLNSKLSIKPGFYYTHNRYRWQGAFLNADGEEVYYVQNNLNLGTSLSYFRSSQHEISFNFYYSFYADKAIDDTPKPTIRGLYFGLYSGWYF